MEQKDNIQENIKNMEVPPINEVKEINPIEDAFNALAEAIDLQGAAEDGTALFGAILAMPEDQFEIIAPTILDNMQRSMNDPN